MENSDRVMVEIQRLLKPKGIQYAPTFFHNENIKSRIISRIISFFGRFTVYNKWNKIEFIEYVKNFNFTVVEANEITVNLLPDCAIIAKKD